MGPTDMPYCSQCYSQTSLVVLTVTAGPTSHHPPANSGKNVYYSWVLDGAQFTQGHTMSLGLCLSWVEDGMPGVSVSSDGFKTRAELKHSHS